MVLSQNWKHSPRNLLRLTLKTYPQLSPLQAFKTGDRVSASACRIRRTSSKIWKVQVKIPRKAVPPRGVKADSARWTCFRSTRSWKRNLVRPAMTKMSSPRTHRSKRRQRSTHLTRSQLVPKIWPSSNGRRMLSHQKLWFRTSGEGVSLARSFR